MDTPESGTRTDDGRRDQREQTAIIPGVPRDRVSANAHPTSRCPRRRIAAPRRWNVRTWRSDLRHARAGLLRRYRQTCQVTSPNKGDTSIAARIEPGKMLPAEVARRPELRRYSVSPVNEVPRSPAGLGMRQPIDRRCGSRVGYDRGLPVELDEAWYSECSCRSCCNRVDTACHTHGAELRRGALVCRSSRGGKSRELCPSSSRRSAPGTSSAPN
jgi:hypothetical protein